MLLNILTLLLPGLIPRFDLLHVMLDELTEDDDERIAAHIVALHKDPAATIGRAPFTMEQLQRFIKYARSIKPRLTPQVGKSWLLRVLPDITPSAGRH